MKTVISHEKLWAANSNGRYGWLVKVTWSDGSITWLDSK